MKTTKDINREIEQLLRLIKPYTLLSDIPKIENDIILQKLRSIYEFFLDNKTYISEEVIDQEIRNAELVHDIKINDSLMGDISVVEMKNDKTENEIEFITEINEENNKEEVAKTVNFVHEPNKENDKDTNKKTLADLYLKNQPNINELFASKTKRKDLSSVLQSKPISKLEEAIDINDKFLFLRELFHNDIKNYENTLRMLDQLHTFNDAINYLENHFIWKNDSEAVRRFIAIVRRRFIIDE